MLKINISHHIFHDLTFCHCSFEIRIMHTVRIMM